MNFVAGCPHCGGGPLSCRCGGHLTPKPAPIEPIATHRVICPCGQRNDFVGSEKFAWSIRCSACDSYSEAKPIPNEDSPMIEPNDIKTRLEAVEGLRERLEMVEKRCAALQDSSTALDAKITVTSTESMAAKMTAESLRASLVAQQKIVDRANSKTEGLAKRFEDQRMGALKDRSADGSRIAALECGLTRANTRIEAAKNHSEANTTAIAQAGKDTKELKAMYEKENEAAVDAVPVAVEPVVPGIGEAFKQIGSIAMDGVKLGLTVGFISEAAALGTKKLVAAGMISQELADNEIFQACLTMAIPGMLLLASSHPSMPKRAFVQKVSAMALHGQSAQHAAKAMKFAVSLGSEFLALPSAQGLEARLEAAE